MYYIYIYRYHFFTQTIKVALFQYNMIVNKRYKLVALQKCKYICKTNVKTNKILKCIKNLLTLKTYKIYTTFCCQRQLDHVYSNIVKILVKL